MSDGASGRSWGGLPQQPQTVLPLNWADEVPALMSRAGLPVGCGRSYGDSALAHNGIALGGRGLRRMLAFDREQGTLRCESGVTLGEILALTIPAGWMLPVVPGTRFVTLAGAIANDVHGKNHPANGSFGCHLRSLVLRRSDGEVLHCSAAQNSQWFAATVAGLGLTGFILEAQLQLQPLSGAFLDTQTTRFAGLDEFAALNQASKHEYNAAWIDCLSADCRGHFTSASHSASEAQAPPPQPLLAIPGTLPVSPINSLSLRAFNQLYYHRLLRSSASSEQLLYRWFFPLDRISHWNRLYGRRGFRQYQCALPLEAVADLLRLIRRSGDGSFLAVLKMFGDRQSPGLLSFPRPGATLALDFPWRGESTLALFRALDDIVMAHEGAIYPAKDAHMPPALFRAAYPCWELLEQLRDPQLQSSFWHRMTQTQ
jgi:FAD/FMN-containing dehydrogenase